MTFLRSVPPEYAFPLLGRFGACVLARDGTLWTVLEMQGVDPDALDREGILSMTGIARNALSALPNGARRQEYFLHYRHAPSPFPVNGHPVVASLERARHTHLSSKALYRSRLYHCIGLQTHALTSHLGPIDAINTLLLSPFDGVARRRLARWLKRDAELSFLIASLERGAHVLRDVVDAYRRRWSSVSDSEIARCNTVWRLGRALSELDPSLIDSKDEPPVDHWYAAMLRGRITAVSTDSTEYLKAESNTRFARVASFVRLANRVVPGFWIASRPAILACPGTFVAASNTRSLSSLESAFTFKRLRDEVSRAQLNLVQQVMQGSVEGKSSSSPEDEARQARARADHAELHAAERLDEHWTRAQFGVLALGSTATEARQTALSLDASFSASNVSVVWETPAAHHAYTGLQLGAQAFAPRTLLLNTTQCAAAVLAHRHSIGVDIEVQPDRAVTALETMDGQLFGFTPFVGERATVIGLGPSRSGKTFLKNTLAASWPRWGGHVVAIDYDPGSECLADLYGPDAGVVRDAQGMNPFAAGAESTGFRAHFTRLMRAMMAGNDAAGLRELTDDEQAQVDRALESTLALPGHLRRLSAFARHLTPATAAKFARWLADPVSGVPGRYAALLDHVDDRIGGIDKLVSVFNLSTLRDDADARVPILLELLWRVTLAFEDPSRRHLPKKLVLDEAHLALRDDILGAFIPTKGRTWNKWNASLELWNHQVGEYTAMRDWDALRGSASTFMFTATPDASTDAYIGAFAITPADVEVIRSLVPKRELYLIQPDIGIRKRLILDPDPAALRWAGSSPGGAHHGTSPSLAA